MKKKMNLRKVAVTAIMAAIAAVLIEFPSFPIPAIMPGFIKFDFSELPALLTSFSLGPQWAIVVCLIKNMVSLLSTSTGGVGELSNFILSCAFVVPAGLIYRKFKTRAGAFWGSLTGALTMAGLGVLTNYFVVYPIYANLMGGMDNIVRAYQVILPSTDSLIECLLIFNLPFTFVKGMVSVLITFLIYKKISPILKGKEV
ncbi:MAG: ECF transporter S component [Clostridia bacterium]|nr:ECF transporter S component [Clostridia bacterium]